MATAVGRGWAARLGPATAGLAALVAAREVVARAREADLAGQVVAITGGSRGLGLELARRFGAEGCQVAICARDADELERARALLAGDGVQALTVTADIAARADCERFIAEVTERFGRVDVLVNNAGFIAVGPVESTEHEDYEHAMGVMYFGVLYPTLAVLPQMRERRSGRIVNVTSVGGKVSTPHLVPYCAAKFAAVGLSEGLHAELANDGITVTTICPGELRTGSYLHASFSGDQEAEYRWFALGASQPWVTSADRAARIIVRATKRGEAERTFPWTVDLGARLAHLAPVTTARVMRMVDRRLPKGDQKATDPGQAVERRLRPEQFDAAKAAERTDVPRRNQLPGPLTNPFPPHAAEEESRGGIS